MFKIFKQSLEINANTNRNGMINEIINIQIGYGINIITTFQLNYAHINKISNNYA